MFQVSQYAVMQNRKAVQQVGQIAIFGIRQRKVNPGPDYRLRSDPRRHPLFSGQRQRRIFAEPAQLPGFAQFGDNADGTDHADFRSE